MPESGLIWSESFLKNSELGYSLLSGGWLWNGLERVRLAASAHYEDHVAQKSRERKALANENDEMHSSKGNLHGFHTPSLGDF